MSIKRKYQRYNTGMPELDRNFQSIELSLNSLYNNPIQHGIEKRDVVINTTDTVVDHLLGTEQIRWIVTDQNADARIWRTDKTKNTITLRASAQVTVSLYIY